LDGGLGLGAIENTLPKSPPESDPGLLDDCRKRGRLENLSFMAKRLCLTHGRAAGPDPQSKPAKQIQTRPSKSK